MAPAMPKSKAPAQTKATNVPSSMSIPAESRERRSRPERFFAAFPVSPDAAAIASSLLRNSIFSAREAERTANAQNAETTAIKSANTTATGKLISFLPSG